MIVVPPKSRVVVMGRLSGGRQVRNLPHSVVVEPVSTRNPGVYAARVVSDVYVRAGNSFDKLSDAHRSSQIEETGNQEPDWVSNNRNQGVPEKEWDARAVLIPESADDSVENKDREPCYCLLEIMNTGSSPVEIGKM